MIGMMVPSVFAEGVPDWVKNTAGWWAEDTISEKQFVNAVGFLVNEGIIQIQATINSEKSETVPDWVKNTAGRWAEDTISEKQFVNAVGFLVNEGIIQINNECKFKIDTYAGVSTDNKWFLCNLNYLFVF
jgi:peptide subunit release factor RF-3